MRQWTDADSQYVLEIERRLAKALKDSERLDFLDSLNLRLNARYGSRYSWKMVINHNVNRLMAGDMKIDLSDAEANGLPSCRGAIDVEMARIVATDVKPDAEVTMAFQRQRRAPESYEGPVWYVKPTVYAKLRDEGANMAFYREIEEPLPVDATCKA